MKTLQALLLMLALTVAVAQPAGAHHQISQNRWWFGGSTYSERAADDKVDPVNLFFYPGWTTKALLDQHFNDHVGPTQGNTEEEPNEWTEDADFSETVPKCKGDQFVKFRRPPNDSSRPSFEPVQTDFHGAMTDVGIGPTECANRYHIRFWEDDTHETLTDTQHAQPDAWIIGAAHYEDVINEENVVGHAPTLPWEVVEYRVTQFMRPHAITRRWKCLPNSRGLYQKYRNDGRISRISLRHGGDHTEPTSDSGRC